MSCKPRWMVERKYAKENKVYQVVEVYAEGEDKELVKEENKQWTSKRTLLLIQH